MKAVKSEQVSFPSKGKETFKDRLKVLIGERSVRAAAKDWGLSVSTLNNYLNRGTEPTLGVINTISSIEDISIDWLANGTKEVAYVVQDTIEPNSVDTPELTQLKQAWNMVFDALEPKEANDLLKYIHRNGVVGVLNKGQSKVFQLTVEDAIDSLPIRATLKQAIKVALAGDEAMDKEILCRISKDEEDWETEGSAVQGVNKNAG
ncbi:putative Similar to regulatory protein of Escherichia coli O157:H7 [Xenorhabdus bovienii str. oregonense]|uniref:Putative Similar to regulatory protein of Escherichia coli O157:H7 n=1 Tax=Xenorhabdus bovienii str. oregonense TaxID=1398202 RepID=A0A077NSH0_XENBV|nr:transcriptional regulator [Xenorhabdus bovienii]CDH05022.1 putative Similar to regulatory protein of Escherichia coli O157:H7 [Xenorhabdus bovienii str. oregonense]